MGSRRSSGQKKVVTSYRNSDVMLVMECGSQPLSDTQLELKNKIEEEYNQFTKKLNETISKRGGEVIEQGTHVTVYEIDCSPKYVLEQYGYNFYFIELDLSNGLWLFNAFLAY